MAFLKEIKSRIASVNSTLKITSAMKMVASAKLHRVQSKAEALAEYENRLSQISAALSCGADAVISPLSVPHKTFRRAIVVAFSSDGSLCGGFNANVIRALDERVRRLRAEGFAAVTVYPVGEKIAQAAHKYEYDVCDDFRGMAGAPDYGQTTELAERLMKLYAEGETDRVCLVYNHFHSMSRQEPTFEIFLPTVFSSPAANASADLSADYLYEPGPARLLTELLPYSLRIKLYKVLLDSSTAEHAARMIAMQAATDNGKELLDELSLIYNKRRQQAITDEVADISGTE